jgi:hypothetical protein
VSRHETLERPATGNCAPIQPGFLRALIRGGVLGFMEVSPGGMPYPLVFLLLPIVLHKATRESLPGTVATKMHPWIQQHQGARVGFSERCAAVAAYTRESILFARLARY